MTADSKKLRVLVVDDEAPARLRLLDALRFDPDISQVLEAGDGETAVRIIGKERPNLVLLDVQMPELDGLGVVASIGAERMPLTIFVTAYDQHAIRAFEANALDYVLKPYSDERIEAALARAKGRLDDFHLREFGESLLRGLASGVGRYLDRLTVKAGGVTRLILVREIDWVQASGVYVTLHVGKTEFLYRASLSELHDKLDPARFIRVHRSALVNIDSIVQLESISHGEFEVALKGGSRTRVSRGFKAQLEHRLGQTL